MNDVAPPRRARSAALEPGEHRLQVISIAKSYDKRVVLADVTLEVGEGEVVGLLGPNGAGKTTCFYSIMGLVKPDSGRVVLEGVDITGLAHVSPVPFWALAICRRKTSIFPAA